MTSPTLPSGGSLARLAEILQFATLLGSAERISRLSPDGDQCGVPRHGNSPSDFSAAVFELFQLLRGRSIHYLLVGGVALLRYVPGRNTEDIDLLLAVEELPKLPELVLEDRNEWFAKGRFRGIRVDLLFTVNPFFRLVLEQYATVHPFLEQDVPCATAEGLLLLKLYALPSLYRQGDLQRANLYESDIAAVLLANQLEMDPLFQELARYVSQTDLLELRKIVAELQARQKRFGNSPSNG